MVLEVTTSWMTIQELMEETGMSRSAAYNAAANGTLPVPVHRFGKRYLISRKALEELKTKQLPPSDEISNQATGCVRN